MSTSLMTVRYLDSSRAIHLTAYADMVVYDDSGNKNTLYAIRFGGYPEQVGGLAAAISGGGAIELETGSETIILHPLLKQYRRTQNHNGVYAEAALIADDEIQKAKEISETPTTEDGGEQTTLAMPPRNILITVAPGDSGALFDAIDSKTGVPLIPEFQDYLLRELKRRGILKPLAVRSTSLSCYSPCRANARLPISSAGA